MCIYKNFTPFTFFHLVLFFLNCPLITVLINYSFLCLPLDNKRRKEIVKRSKRIKLYFPGDGKDTAIERLERLDALMPRCHYVTAPCDFFGFRDKRGSPKTRKFVRLGALTPRLPSYYMSFRLSEILQLLLHESIYEETITIGILII